MRLIRPLLLLVVVTGATAAAVYWRWPDLEPVLGTAFGGLLLLHFYALARLARLEDRLARYGGRASRKVAERRAEPPGSRPPTRAPKSGKEGKISESGVTSPRVVTPTATRRERGTEEPEKVEEFLRVVLEDQEAEDVSFLPPYASDEAEDVSFLDPYPAGEDDSPEFREPPFREAPTVSEGAGAALSGEAPMADLGDASDEVVAGSEPREGYRNVPIPRHFALGTVAIIRNALTPAEVAQVLVEQRKRPREKFGELAVELGLLSEPELRELLLAQQQGLFTDEEIREARGRIKAFRELEASASSQ